jgi:hypothetical protein
MKDYLEELLELELALIPNASDSDQTEFVPPCEFDRWVMALAAIYFAAGPIPQGIEEIVEPIFSLGEGGHCWIETFLHNFFEHGPAIINDDAEKACYWKALITLAKSSPKWEVRKIGFRYHLKQLWCEILGFSGHPSRSAGVGWTRAVLLLKDEIVSWCKLWLRDSDAASAFASFVASTNSEQLQRVGIMQLGSALNTIEQHSWGHDRLTPSLMAALHNVWRVHPEIVAPGREASPAFHAILSYLTARLVPEAIELQSRVATG